MIPQHHLPADIERTSMQIIAKEDVYKRQDLYLKALAQIQNGIAACADHVCRVVCGIPVYYKGGDKV